MEDFSGLSGRVREYTLIEGHSGESTTDPPFITHLVGGTILPYELAAIPR